MSNYIEKVTIVGASTSKRSTMMIQHLWSQLDALITTMGVRSTSGHSAKLLEAAAIANVPTPPIPRDRNAEQKDILIGPPKEAERNLIEKLGKSSWVGITCSFRYEYRLGGGPALYGFDFDNRSVTFYDKGTQKNNTTTWPQTALAVDLEAARERS
ncbi:hypothetical protein C8J56DRAFT_1073371 [Mycena floridula]|nr:hypothetical protein C8J56DRAFT_1073371 [Mycena floridula]